jgi:hypothetical protein
VATPTISKLFSALSGEIFATASATRRASSTSGSKKKISSRLPIAEAMEKRSPSRVQPENAGSGRSWRGISFSARSPASRATSLASPARGAPDESTSPPYARTNPASSTAPTHRAPDLRIDTDARIADRLAAG